MVDGGTFNGQTITGLGIPKVAKIYYEVQTHLLTSGADYADLYEALYQGCNNLVGTAGITAADCQQVRNATLAVEMNLQPVPGFNPDAPLCSTGQTPMYIFFDNLEAGRATSPFSAAVGASRWLLARRGTRTPACAICRPDDFPAVITDTSASMASGRRAAERVPAFRACVRVPDAELRRGRRRIQHQRRFDVDGCRPVVRHERIHRRYRERHRQSAGRPPGIRRRQPRVHFEPPESVVVGGSERSVPLAHGTRIPHGGALGWVVDDVRIYTCSGAGLTPSIRIRRRRARRISTSP